MIRNKRILSFAASLFAVSGAFADVQFTNLVSATPITYTWLQDESDQWSTKKGIRPLGYIKEGFWIDYDSKKLDFGANAEVTFSRQYGSSDFYYNNEISKKWLNDEYDNNSGIRDNAYWDLRFTDFDLYLRYRPFKYLTVFVSDDIWADGSYLPVSKLNMASGNLGSDLGLMIPYKNFKFAAGLDVVSYFMADKEKDVDIWTGMTSWEKMPKVNFGGHWNNSWMSAGAAVRDAVNLFSEGFGKTNNHEGSIGGYLAFRGTGWTINVGGAYNNVYDYKWDINNQYPNAEILGFIDQYRVEGKVLGTVGLSAWNEKLSIDFDLVTNVGMNKDDPFNKSGDADSWDLRTRSALYTVNGEYISYSKTYAHYYSGFDLYAGLRGTYKFTKDFKTELVLKGVADFNPAQRTGTTSDTAEATGNDSTIVSQASDKTAGRGAVFEVNPSVSYTYKWHTWSFGFDIIYADPYVRLSIPMSWKYIF